jgi:hypothetical protein
VLASGLGIIFSIAFGITATLVIGAGCYALLMVPALVLFPPADLQISGDLVLKPAPTKITTVDVAN